MHHPLFSPLKNFYFYLLAWAEIMIAHAMIIYYYSHSPLFLAVADSLIFNLSFAAFALGTWYAVRFIKIDKGNWNRILVNHFAAFSIFLTVWVGLGTFIMELITDNAAYQQLLQDAIPFRLLAGSLYYLVIVFFYYSYSYYVSSRENLLKASELKALVKETQLELLKNQMNPHFIFNSLNSISALTIIDPEKARQMIISLSSFLRYSLSQKPDQLISFSEELENGLLYLNIEKMRFGDRLVLERKIEQASSEVLVPGLILQPILENAVKHGAYESLAPVKISLDAKLEKDFLIIMVGNNYESGGNRSGKGIGLKNIKEKLHLVYGPYAALHITDEENYFQVMLRIPVTTTKKEA